LRIEGVAIGGRGGHFDFDLGIYPGLEAGFWPQGGRGGRDEGGGGGEKAQEEDDEEKGRAGEAEEGMRRT